MLTLVRTLVASATLVAATVALADGLSKPPAELSPLLLSIEQRLNIADQVALSKWDSKRAIEDRAREREVIAGAVLLAPEHKLGPGVVEQFFAAQIEANKLVQYGHLADWRLAGKAPDTARPDLIGQIRPQLDELQKTLMAQLADFIPYRTDVNCPQWLAQAAAQGQRDDLHRLALVRATGELCTSTVKP